MMYCCTVVLLHTCMYCSLNTMRHPRLLNRTSSPLLPVARLIGWLLVGHRLWLVVVKTGL